MIYILETFVLLTQLIQLGSANPIGFTQSQPDGSSLTDTEIGTTIPLRRSKHDLQQSSNALRRRAMNFNLAQHNTAGSSQPQYQVGYAILRSTGASFLAPISFGSQSFLAVVDTGSADTWVAASNVQCLDVVTGTPIPRARCGFGNLYDSTKSGFKQIPNENFNITYGDGEFLTGPVGTLDLGFAGIRVPNQTVSVVDKAAWLGDHMTSGLFGLAYPALTAVYPGTDPHQDQYCSPGRSPDQCNQIWYSSLTDNMFFQQKVAKSVFALALSRDESRRGDGGYLTIGGIPQLDQVGVKSNTFASTKIKVLPMDDRLRYYLIGVEGLVMLPVGTPITADVTPSTTTGMSTTTTTSRTGTTTRSSSTKAPGGRNGNNGGNWWGNWWGGGQPSANPKNSRRDFAAEQAVPTGTNAQNGVADYILDSGTTLSYIPDAQAQKFNAMFSPPATFDAYSGYYIVQCNAQIPSLGVRIDGTVFWHNPKDLVKRFDSTGKECVSGIQSSRATGLNILGDVFLDSVLAVFDLGQGVIQFAARREYQS